MRNTTTRAHDLALVAGQHRRAPEAEAAPEPIIQQKNKGRAIAFLSGGKSKMKGMTASLNTGIAKVGSSAKKMRSELGELASELGQRVIE